MLATILRDESRAAPLRSAFASVFPEGSADQEIVGEFVFSELARELFNGYDSNADIVQEFAASLKGLLSASSSIGESDILAAIRGALEGESRRSKVDAFDLMGIHIYFCMAAASQLGVTPGGLAARFARAEEQAAVRGIWLTGEDGVTSGLPEQPVGAGVAAVPRDSRAVHEPIDGRVDLGSLILHVPPRTRISLVSREQGEIVAVEVHSGDAKLSLQVFSSPTRGLWDQIRSEMRDDVVRRAGTAVELDGLGRELWAQYLSPAAAHAEIQQTRIIGYDGPGWFLRGTFTWRGQRVQDDLATLERVYGDVIVVRGESELPDSAPLPLAPPDR